MGLLEQKKGREGCSHFQFDYVLSSNQLGISSFDTRPIAGKQTAFCFLFFYCGF